MLYQVQPKVLRWVFMLLEEKCNTHEVVKILLDGGRFKSDPLISAMHAAYR